MRDDVAGRVRQTQRCLRSMVVNGVAVLDSCTWPCGCAASGARVQGSPWPRPGMAGLWQVGATSSTRDRARAMAYDGGAAGKAKCLSLRTVKVCARVRGHPVVAWPWRNDNGVRRGNLPAAWGRQARSRGEACAHGHKDEPRLGLWLAFGQGTPARLRHGRRRRGDDRGRRRG